MNSILLWFLYWIRLIDLNLTTSLMFTWSIVPLYSECKINPFYETKIKLWYCSFSKIMTSFFISLTMRSRSLISYSSFWLVSLTAFLSNHDKSLIEFLTKNSYWNCLIFESFWMSLDDSPLKWLQYIGLLFELIHPSKIAQEECILFPTAFGIE